MMTKVFWNGTDDELRAELTLHHTEQFGTPGSFAAMDRDQLLREYQKLTDNI